MFINQLVAGRRHLVPSMYTQSCCVDPIIPCAMSHRKSQYPSPKGPTCYNLVIFGWFGECICVNHTCSIYRHMDRTWKFVRMIHHGPQWNGKVKPYTFLHVIHSLGTFGGGQTKNNETNKHKGKLSSTTRDNLVGKEFWTNPWSLPQLVNPDHPNAPALPLRLFITAGKVKTRFLCSMTCPADKGTRDTQRMLEVLGPSVTIEPDSWGPWFHLDFLAKKIKNRDDFCRGISTFLLLPTFMNVGHVEGPILEHSNHLLSPITNEITDHALVRHGWMANPEPKHRSMYHSQWHKQKWYHSRG